MSDGVDIRPIGVDEHWIVRSVLFDALNWDSDNPIPVSHDEAMAHPEVGRYHEDWGRYGDLGVAARVDGAVIGGAYCRLFTETNHGAGYVDDATPELAIAIQSGHRGMGVGGQLLAALEELAREAGIARLSLSVQRENPAARLYRRCGYESVKESSDFLMIKLL